ncbi:MAG: cell wall-binding repeat-containing protein [Coriobacteriia bacterium]|nr:cell wall-binding repeat-containing protein [Coriobacteriia bacterium]
MVVVLHRSSTRTACPGASARFVPVVLVLLASILVLPATASAGSVPPSDIRIAIDAGHGGAYSGAYYNGVAEKTLNLLIAKKLAAELERRGYDVTLTRWSDTKVHSGSARQTWLWSDSEDRYLYRDWAVRDAEDRLRQDLQARCDVANRSGADLFVSIHNNAGGTAYGAESYRAPNDPLGSQFANDVQTELVAETGARNRGVHSARFYVIRWSNMPAVLVECGFMSNPSELGRLRSSSYQAKLARGVADGIERFVERPVDEPLDRYWGTTRYDTAVAVSRAGWPTAPALVLASGEVFADSLVAAPLAHKLGSPILLTPASGLPVSVAEEISRLSPSRMVVVGGPNSVPDDVLDSAAKAAGLDPADSSEVERLGGRTRYEVALAVAARMGVSLDTPIVLASGEVFPDALSVAASAAERGEPILLASAQELPEEVRVFVGEGDAQRGLTVVGGTNTLPNALFEGMEYERLAGRTRYDTNWMVFQQRYDAAARAKPMVASAFKFPDALVLGPYAAQQGRPVLLVGKTATPTYVREWIYENRDTALDFDIVGGPASVSAYFSAMLDKMEMRSY